MRKKVWIPIVAVIAVVSLLWFVAGRRRQPTEPLKIGAILSMTGDAASYGDMMKKGMDLAIEEINTGGGVNGVQMQLVYEDSQFDPKQAVNAFMKLTNVDGVKVITGITGSKNALAVVPNALRQKVVIIDALSSSPKLTEFGGEYYFRVMPSDFLAGHFIADKSYQKGQRKAGVFYANDDWGRGILNSAQSKFHSLGGQVAASESIEPGVKDFRSIIRKILIADPDIIWLFAYAPEAGQIVKQLREQKSSIPVIGSDNLSAGEFTNVGPENVEGVKFVLPVEGEGKAYDEFRERFKNKYGESPSINSIKSYDTVKLAAEAIKKAGYDAGKISRYLKEEQDFTGASGRITFDEHGDINNPAYQVMIYRNGKYQFLER
jgi:branched-chain amino acid transport system substrate-binding protein